MINIAICDDSENDIELLRKEIERYQKEKYICVRSTGRKPYTTISTLTSDTKYTFAVRAYKALNGAYVYSPFSAVKSVTVK